MDDLITNEIRPIYYQWTNAGVGELEGHRIRIAVTLAIFSIYLKIFSVGEIFVEFIHEDDREWIEDIFEVLANAPCLKA